MATGVVDTNVFVHALAPGPQREECRRFLAALERGDVEADLEAPVLHELSYVLPRYVKQMTRRDVAEYMLMALSWPGVRGEKALLVDAVTRWRDSAGLGFVDAYLAARAGERGYAVYTKNLADFRDQGVDVPGTLPGSAG